MDEKMFRGKLAYLDAINIKSFDGILQIMIDAARHSGATVMNYIVTPFPGGGESICVTLSESHIAMHSYPEYNSAFFDIFTCGDHCDPVKAMEYVKEKLNCDGEIGSVNRGHH